MNVPKTQLTSRFEEALTYATRLHSEQTRKGSSTPYISHLLSVAALVLEDGGNEDEAIAALLHDALEDQGGAKTRQAILEKFGAKVVTIVDGCTESEILPKPPWRERKLAALEHLRLASPQVRRVILADKLHNARSILMDLDRQGETVWNRFKGGKEGTLWFYNAIVEVAKKREGSVLLLELERVVKRLENLAR